MVNSMTDTIMMLIIVLASKQGKWLVVPVVDLLEQISKRT